MVESELASIAVGVREDGTAPYLVICPVMFGISLKIACGCAFKTSTDPYSSDLMVYKRVIVLEESDVDDTSELYTDANPVIVKYTNKVIPVILVAEIAKKISEWCENE